MTPTILKHYPNIGPNYQILQISPAELRALAWENNYLHHKSSVAEPVRSPKMRLEQLKKEKTSHRENKQNQQTISKHFRRILLTKTFKNKQIMTPTISKQMI